jgi:hypothetical protein
MAGLFEALLGGDTTTVEKVRSYTGNDPRRAEQAYSAAVGTILRGLEAQTKTEEGKQSIWDMLRQQAEKGNIPTDTAELPQGTQVRDMDSKEVNDIFKTIFGKDAPNVEGGLGKVITLDPETSRQIFAKVLPAVLGTIFGQAEKAPQESPQAIPQIVKGARTEMEQRQPNSKGIFDAILDQDHDGDVDLDDLMGIFVNKPR